MIAHRHAELAAYYAARAGEYDNVYEKPERQHDLGRLREILTTLLGGRRVLEIACGTGYWTQCVADVARSVLAIDVNKEQLCIAGERLRRFSNTALLLDDAFTLSGISADCHFDAGLAAFWWSHVALADLPAFLDVFHSRLGPGALVVFADNRFVAGSNLPMTRTDADGNTYQIRRLADGTAHEIRKNFPEPADLKRILAGRSRGLNIHELQYYWCLSYQIP